MADKELQLSNAVPKPVKPHVARLGELLLDGPVGKSDGDLVVTVDDGGTLGVAEVVQNLSLAGREAQIVSFNFDNSSGKIGPGVPTSDADATDQKVAWVRDAAGDRFDSLELEIGAYFTFVTDQGQATAEAMAPRMGLTVDQMLNHPHALIGSVDTICDELERRRERYGISYVTVGDAAADAFAPVVARLAGR